MTRLRCCSQVLSHVPVPVRLAQPPTVLFPISNCLAYEMIDQCVFKLECALDNDPEPLFPGKAAGMHEASVKAAQFHVDTAKKSSYIGNFLRS